MALSGKFTALRNGIDRGESSGAATELEQAAKLVADFAGQNALPALEALITAAEGEVKPATARSARGTATELTRRTESLYSEVARFLTLTPDQKR